MDEGHTEENDNERHVLQRKILIIKCMQRVFVSERSYEILFDINFYRNSNFTLHIKTFSRFEILRKNNIV